MSEFGEPIRKRRKVSLACVPCRDRKIRCSGEKPVCASCHRRSKECSYAVQIEYVSGVTESIHSVLDRLQRLESQNQSGSFVARKQNVGIARNTSADQRIAHPVLGSEDYEILSYNTKHSSQNLPRLPARYGESSASAVAPRRQPPDSQHLQRHSSNNSDAAHVDEGTALPWMAEAYEMSHESAQNTPGKVDAMGASTVCDESSPQESTQFYGNSSGIAFMRVIRHVPGDRVQENSTENVLPSTDWATPPGDKGNISPKLSKLLPTFEGPRFCPELFALPPRSLCDTLLENYWNRVYPLCPFVHRPTFEAAYISIWSPAGSKTQLAKEIDTGLGNIVDAGPSNQTFYCALNIMLALGSQFLDILVPHRNEITAMFEQRSKDLLVVDMLDRGSIAIVQTLLLSGQYLQSTFCPQRCWNCIGVACRIAQGLGLHVNQSSVQRSTLGREIRRRVWYACVMLDMSVSMTMGRPLMILHKFSTSLPSPLDDEKLQAPDSSNFPTIGMFSESIKLLKTLGIILTTIYDQNVSNANIDANNPKNIQIPSDIDTVLNLDKSLTKFQNELPVELQWIQDGERLRHSFGPDVGNSEMLSNVLHARFLQTRILLYRTTFTRLCQDMIWKMNPIPSDSYASSDCDIDNYFIIRAAISCVTSARELIELIHRTLQKASSDAWWYNVYYVHTAGMVIKMAQLCNPVEHFVNASCLDESWTLCRETLSKMSLYGQVPKRCLESLEALQQKISQLELCIDNIRHILAILANKISAANSKVKSHLPQASECVLSTPQQASPPNTSGRSQVSSRECEYNPQLSEQGICVEGSTDNVGVLSETPERTVRNEDHYPYWSTDLIDLWNFPGGDFGLDDLAFASQI